MIGSKSDHKTLIKIKWKGLKLNKCTKDTTKPNLAEAWFQVSLKKSWSSIQRSNKEPYQKTTNLSAKLWSYKETLTGQLCNKYKVQKTKKDCQQNTQ